MEAGAVAAEAEAEEEEDLQARRLQARPDRRVVQAVVDLGVVEVQAVVQAGNT